MLISVFSMQQVLKKIDWSIDSYLVKCRLIKYICIYILHVYTYITLYRKHCIKSFIVYLYLPSTLTEISERCFLTHVQMHTHSNSLFIKMKLTPINVFFRKFFNQSNFWKYLKANEVKASYCISSTIYLLLLFWFFYFFFFQLRKQTIQFLLSDGREAGILSFLRWPCHRSGRDVVGVEPVWCGFCGKKLYLK